MNREKLDNYLSERFLALLDKLENNPEIITSITQAAQKVIYFFAALILFPVMILLPSAGRRRK